MKFALILNNEVKEYREYPSQPDCKIIDGLPVIRPVVELAKPAYDPMTEKLTRVDTIFDDRVEWSWIVEELSPEQIAANQQAAADAALLVTAKADTFVQTFVAMTFAEVATYVDNNVTDLASAKTLLKRMAQLLLYLAKQTYR